jgi:hypothetical protein
MHKKIETVTGVIKPLNAGKSEARVPAGAQGNSVFPDLPVQRRNVCQGESGKTLSG